MAAFSELSLSFLKFGMKSGTLYLSNYSQLKYLTMALYLRPAKRGK
jgi:hypothetical protein